MAATGHQGDVTDRDLSGIQPETWLGAGVCCLQGGPRAEELPTCDGSAPGIRRPGASSWLGHRVTLAKSLPLGLHVTTHRTFRMDVPSSNVLGKTQGMIQSSAGPEGNLRGAPDGERAQPSRELSPEPLCETRPHIPWLCCALFPAPSL